MVGRAELLFSEVLNTLRQIEKNGSRRRIGELEFILKKEKAEFEVSFFAVLVSRKNFNFQNVVRVYNLFQFLGSD